VGPKPTTGGHEGQLQCTLCSLLDQYILPPLFVVSSDVAVLVVRPIVVALLLS
jgi:hypothetical protein